MLFYKQINNLSKSHFELIRYNIFSTNRIGGKPLRKTTEISCRKMLHRLGWIQHIRDVRCQATPWHFQVLIVGKNERPKNVVTCLEAPLRSLLVSSFARRRNLYVPTQ